MSNAINQNDDDENSIIARFALPVSQETETGLDMPQPILSVVPEKFIPLDRSNVVELVIESLFAPEQQELAANVIHYMAVVRQMGTAALLDELVENYDPFNPDDETVNSLPLSDLERDAQLNALRAKVVDLVTSANYNEINQEKLQQLLNEGSVTGFMAEVDLDEYDFHLLYYRGDAKDHHLKRSWKTLGLLRRPQEFDIYRRLFIGLKLKPVEVRVQELMDKQSLTRRKAEKKVKRLRNNQMLEGVSEETLHLKVFRRIPHADLRILFPNVKVKFNKFDKYSLYFGSSGSMIIAIGIAINKISIIGIGAVSIFAHSFLSLIIALSGAVGTAIRSVFNIFNTRTRYMAKLAKNLYFHNIASNQSVLAMMADDAEEEDIKEAVLSYALLLKYGFGDLQFVKEEAARLLKHKIKAMAGADVEVDVDFDIEDGFKHLEWLGLLSQDADGAYQLLDLPEAERFLIQNWQQIPSHPKTA